MKTVVLTRPKRSNSSDIEILEKAGFKTVYFPTVEIETVVSSDIAIQQIIKFNPKYFVFSSPRAVARISEMASSANNFKNIPVISIGERTSAACQKLGFSVLHEAKSATMIGLRDYIAEHNLDKLCYPHSLRGRQELIDYMQGNGKALLNLELYQPSLPKTIHSEQKGQIAKRQFDWLIFTSPSAYDNFKKILDIAQPLSFFLDRQIAVIGETTKAVLAADGISPTIIASKPDIALLANELINFELQRESC